MQEALFTVAKLEDFVPADHPLRPTRDLVNQALIRLSGLFGTIYADTGRASIAPEKLLRAMLIQVFFSVRSERQLMEQVRYNLLYRWFIGLAIDDEVWDHSTFSKNRDRLLEHAVIESFFTEVMTLADQRGLLSRDHFSVDGTLIQAWASHKSFVPRDGGSDDANSDGPGGRNTQADWKGKPRGNDTHASTTDPDARLFRKSRNTAAVMSYQGHVLMEHRSGLVVGAAVTHADGMGERLAALRMLDTVPGTHPKTVAADKAYRHPRLRRGVPPAPRDAPRGEPSHAPRRQRHRWSNHTTSRLCDQSNYPQAHRRALRVGQDDRADPPDRLPRHQASRPALQIDDDRKQHCANGPNVQRGAARSGTMSRPCEPRDTAPMPDGDNQPSTRRTTHRLLSHQLQ